MTNVKIANETGAITFLDNDGSLINNIFINNYYFGLINGKQKDALKIALSREDVEYQELWLKDDNQLYLTYVSKQGQQLVDIISNDGLNMTRYAIDYINEVDELNLLHDFAA